MDTEDILGRAVIFVTCLIATILIILALIGTVDWFIHLEPAAQLFYGAVFIIAFVLSAAVTYYLFKR